MNGPLTFKPKNGNTLRVLIIGRISTEHQNIENIDASYRYVEDYLRSAYSGATELRHLGERASGMLVDRSTIREASDLIADGDWDLVIAEDLSRIFRNPRHQYNFVQDAVDAQTRVICIADNLDTADENWELMLGAATLRHGLMVSDTRRRVRRTATHSFHSGGMVQKVKYGYRKLTKREADSGDFGTRGLTITRLDECTPIINEMAEKAIDGSTYISIAEWLEREAISPPPYATNGRWTARHVKDLLIDPILSGTRTFRTVVCEPVYSTGRHRRRKNDAPETASAPELAHLSTELHEQVLDVIRQRENAHRSLAGRNHPLQGRSRKISIWPAQHARCAICGDLMHRYDRDTLKCKNSSRSAGRRCWNRVQVNCQFAREVLLAEFCRLLEQEAGIEETVRNAAREEFRRLNTVQNRRRDPNAKRLSKLHQQAANLTQAIESGGNIMQLVERLQETNQEIEKLKKQSVPQHSQPSNDDIDNVLQQPLKDLLVEVASASFQFADLMRTISTLHIFPVQALDTSQVRPMARFTIRLQGDVPNTDSRAPADFEQYLFEPPLYIQHVEECVRAKSAIPTASLTTLAELTKLGRMTVRRALGYARQMQRENTEQPYRILTQTPTNASRWRTTAKLRE